MGRLGRAAVTVPQLPLLVGLPNSAINCCSSSSKLTINTSPGLGAPSPWRARVLMRLHDPRRNAKICIIRGSMHVYLNASRVQPQVDQCCRMLRLVVDDPVAVYHFNAYRKEKAAPSGFRSSLGARERSRLSQEKVYTNGYCFVGGIYLLDFIVSLPIRLEFSRGISVDELASLL